MLQKRSIQKLTRTDVHQFAELIRLFIRVFEEEQQEVPSSEYLQLVLGNPAFHVYVAMQEGKLIGGLTAYEMRRYYNKSSELYIYDIAVENPFQNQGVGKMLMQAICRYAADHQVENIMVEAHEKDEQAVHFYSAIMGTSERVIHFNRQILLDQPTDLKT